MALSMATAMLMGGIASGATSLISSGMQADAANKSADMQMEMYEKTREDLGPFREAGVEQIGNVNDAANGADVGFGRLSADNPYAIETLGKGFQMSQGAQFQMEKGNQAIESSAASRGGMLSGNTLEDLQKNSQGIASQDYWTYINQQMKGGMADFNEKQTSFGNMQGVANMGLNAAAQTGTAGASAAQNAGNAVVAGGTAAAAGVQGVGDAFSNMLSGSISASQTYGSDWANQSVWG